MVRVYHRGNARSTHSIYVGRAIPSVAQSGSSLGAGRSTAATLPPSRRPDAILGVWERETRLPACACRTRAGLPYQGWAAILGLCCHIRAGLPY
eukprot:7381443-Prymnesium_polylepis.1